MRTTTVRLTALLLAAAMWMACAPSERPLPPAAAEDSTVPREGGRLVRRFASDIGTLNAVHHTTTFEKNVLSYVHDPLVELNKALEISPGLARTWTVSPDGLEYTFEIDPRATFSDGKRVTAEDVVFTLKKITDPEAPSAQFGPLFDALDRDKTRAVDADTARVVFTRARADQLLAFNIPVLPRHFYGRGNFARDFDRKVMGAGPYVLSNIDAGNSILLQRRDDYWRAMPWIREVEFQIVPDDAMAWNAVKAGALHETRMNSDQWKAEKDNPAVRDVVDIRRFYMLGYNFIPWNTRDPILADVRVRRALAMAFDRRAVINNLFYGTARVVTGPYVPDQWAYNPDVKPIEFNLDAARKLLSEAGWTDSDGDGVLDRGGRRLEIELLLPTGNVTSASQAQVFQEALAKIGVRLRLSTVDAPVMFERVLGGKFQSAFLGWDLDLDPDLYALFHSSQVPPDGTNFVGYSNPRVDQLIEEGRTTLNRDRRREIYHELHAILAQDQPYLWLTQVSTKWAVNKRVRNVEEADGLGLFLWYPGPLQWWLADDRAFIGDTLSTTE